MVMHQELQRQFFTISEVSKYLNIKEKTIYAKVEAGEMPCYRIGSLIRFRLNEIDEWLESCRSGHKQECKEPSKKKNNRQSSNLSGSRVDKIARKIIDEETKKYYHTNHGKSDLVKAQDKEVSHGSI